MTPDLERHYTVGSIAAEAIVEGFGMTLAPAFLLGWFMRQLVCCAATEAWDRFVWTSISAAVAAGWMTLERRRR